MPFGAILVNSFLSRTMAARPVRPAMLFQLASVGVVESAFTAQDLYRGALFQASPELSTSQCPHVSGSASCAAGSGAGVSVPRTGVSVPSAMPVVPQHMTVPEDKQMLPDTRLHVLHSIRRRPGDIYQLEYDMTSWGGWLGFWDHVAAIRSDESLAAAARELKPFVGARELLCHGMMYARKRLRDAIQRTLRTAAEEQAFSRYRIRQQSQQEAQATACAGVGLSRAALFCTCTSTPGMCCIVGPFVLDTIADAAASPSVPLQLCGLGCQHFWPTTIQM